MTWIKICGTTNFADAELALEAGADALGFIFARSPRQVSPEVAAEIIRQLPAKVAKVGVFVDETAERVREIAKTTGVTAIQLHGDEDSHYISKLGAQFDQREIIKALSANLGSEGISAKLRGLPKNSLVLLDSGDHAQRGGTGTTFDWTAASSLVASNQTHCWIIAGGLTAQNVAKAIETFHPWGVDVVSGVEATPGHKDPAKVKAFIRAARAADGQR